MNAKNTLFIALSAIVLASCGGGSTSTPSFTAEPSASEKAKNAVDYVLVAEPSMTPALAKNAKAKEYASMSEKYAEKSNGKRIMQASIFVNDSANASKVDAFLAQIKSDVNAFIANPDSIDQYIADMGEDAAKAKLGVPSTAVLKAVTKNGNRMGLGFEDAYANKEAVSTFLSLFGLAVDDSVYYQAGEASASSSYALDLKVVSPSGAPAVSMYKYLSSPEETLEINAVASNVVAYLTPNSTKDIVIAPTNAGITAINKKNAPFKLAATLTFGNFYLASTGNDDDDVLDADDYVVAFQQNNVPDKIFHYVYSDIEFSNLHYVDQASDAAACLISGLNIHHEEAN